MQYSLRRRFLSPFSAAKRLRLAQTVGSTCFAYLLIFVFRFFRLFRLFVSPVFPFRLVSRGVGGAKSRSKRSIKGIRRRDCVAMATDSPFYFSYFSALPAPQGRGPIAFNNRRQQLLPCPLTAARFPSALPASGQINAASIDVCALILTFHLFCLQFLPLASQSSTLSAR